MKAVLFALVGAFLLASEEILCSNNLTDPKDTTAAFAFTPVKTTQLQDDLTDPKDTTAAFAFTPVKTTQLQDDPTDPKDSTAPFAFTPMNTTQLQDEVADIKVTPSAFGFTAVHTTPLPADRLTYSAPSLGEWEIAPQSKFYSCHGRQASFPWKFRTKEGTTVLLARWFFDDGTTTVNVATEVDGQLNPLPKYEQRLAPLAVGGFILKDVTTKDSGTYSMTVVVMENGSFNTKTHAVFLRVTDGLRTKDDTFQVVQDPKAVWDQTVNQWVTRLSCGPFVFWSPPPIHVDWTTPAGATTTLQYYHNGSFNINLPAPVVGGRYKCQIPEQVFPAVCYQGNHPISASVSVDEEKARLTVLEAEQRTLKINNQELKAAVTSLEDEDRALHNEIEEEERKMDILESENKEQEEKMETMESKNKEQEEKIKTFELEFRELRKEVDSQRNISKALEVKHDADMFKMRQRTLCNPVDYKYKFLNDTWRAVTSGSGINCDKHLPQGWYRPTLNSLKATIPTECVAKKHCGTEASTWIDLRGQALPAPGAQIVGRACSNYFNSCCHFAGPAVTVRNCGDFFIFHLKPLTVCQLAYCVQPE